jgi:hypothetical protein
MDQLKRLSAFQNQELKQHSALMLRNTPLSIVIGDVRLRTRTKVTRSAAALRRVPIVEVDPTITLIGPHGPVTLLETFEGGRRQQFPFGRRF